MSELALKILAEFRALAPSERAEVAATVNREFDADAAERLRILEEITSRYRSEGDAPASLHEEWVDGILPSKHTP